MCTKTDFMNKIQQERELFEKWIMTLPKEQMMEHCYEYVIKSDIVYYFEENNLDNEKYILLMKSPCIIEDVFKTFNKFDLSEYLETLGMAVRKTAESI